MIGTPEQQARAQHLVGQQLAAEGMPNAITMAAREMVTNATGTDENGLVVLQMLVQAVAVEVANCALNVAQVSPGEVLAETFAIFSAETSDRIAANAKALGYTLADMNRPTLRHRPVAP
jgi:hypothetical protein